MTGSEFVLVEDHVGDAVDDGVLPLAVWADQLTLHDVGLPITNSTSRIIRCSFRSSSSF